MIVSWTFELLNKRIKNIKNNYFFINIFIILNRMKNNHLMENYFNEINIDNNLNKNRINKLKINLDINKIHL